MATIDEVLSRLSKTPVSPVGNAFTEAQDLTRGIVQFQKNQRAQPLITNLQDLSSQFAQAPTVQQSKLNARANALRAAYINSGGSPTDLPKELWGSDPSQGFQTGTGQFNLGSADDNLSFGQKLKRAPITGMFENKPIWERQYQQGLLDISRLNAQNTQDKNYLDKMMDIQKNLTEQGNKQTENINKAIQDAHIAIDKAMVRIPNPDSKTRSTNPYIMTNMRPEMKSQMKDVFNRTFNRLRTNGITMLTPDMQKAVLQELPEGGGWDVINALNSALKTSPKQ